MTLARCSYIIAFNSASYLLLDCYFEITKSYQFGESSHYCESYRCGVLQTELACLLLLFTHVSDFHAYMETM